MRRGVALLEAAGWLVLVTSLFLGVVTWGIVLNEQAELDELAYGQIKDSSVTGVVLDASGNLVVNVSGLAAWSHRLESTLLAEATLRYPNRRILVAACYWMSQVNEETGETSHRIRICPTSEPDGRQIDLLEKDLDRWFEGRPSPSSIRIVHGELDQYFGTALVLGVAVRIDATESTGAAFAISRNIHFGSNFLPAGDIGL